MKMISSPMKMSLKRAEGICNTAINTAVTRGYAPITVVVLDCQGHTVVSKRMDGCSPVGMRFSPGQEAVILSANVRYVVESVVQ